MDESTINVTKGIEGLELNSSVTMMVWGYDTSLPDDDIKSLLSEHFSSCGEITQVYIPPHAPIKIRNKYAFVYITGEDAKEKALQFNGSDLGGRKLRVQVMMRSTEHFTVTPNFAAVRAEHAEELSRTFRILVSGYNPYVPEDVNKTALAKLFSSCGEIKSVNFLEDTEIHPPRRVVLRIVGDGVAEKVRAISACDMGEWILHTVHCCENSNLSRGIIRGTAFPPGITQRKKPRMATELRSSFFLSVTR